MLLVAVCGATSWVGAAPSALVLVRAVAIFCMCSAE